MSKKCLHSFGVEFKFEKMIEWKGYASGLHNCPTHPRSRGFQGIKSQPLNVWDPLIIDRPCSYIYFFLYYLITFKILKLLLFSLCNSSSSSIFFFKFLSSNSLKWQENPHLVRNLPKKNILFPKWPRRRSSPFYRSFSLSQLPIAQHLATLCTTLFGDVMVFTKSSPICQNCHFLAKPLHLYTRSIIHLTVYTPVYFTFQGWWA